MEKKLFWVITGNNSSIADTICSLSNDLRIRVYYPDDNNWMPTLNEVQLYSCVNGRTMVFETVNIKPDDALDMADAILWYAAYIGSPDMLIFTQEPRYAQRVTYKRAATQSANGAAHTVPATSLQLIN